jgi:TonB family protein
MRSTVGKFKEVRKAVKAAFCLMLGLSVAALGQDGAKKLTRAEALTLAVSKVDPEFPAMAKQLRINGAVDLEAVVSESGAVEKVTIVNGNPILTKAGADALMKWKFKPSTADGKPVKVVAPVQFVFKAGS